MPECRETAILGGIPEIVGPRWPLVERSPGGPCLGMVEIRDAQGAI